MRPNPKRMASAEEGPTPDKLRLEFLRAVWHFNTPRPSEPKRGCASLRGIAQQQRSDQ
jgi:hypothetical protein